MIWTVDKPRFKGWYWFYGYFSKLDSEKSLIMVQVTELTKDSPVLSYVVSGHQIEENRISDGVWQRAKEPDLPTRFPFPALKWEDHTNEDNS